jgi:hypothetical protein
MSDDGGDPASCVQAQRLSSEASVAFLGDVTCLSVFNQSSLYSVLPASLSAASLALAAGWGGWGS